MRVSNIKANQRRYLQTPTVKERPITAVIGRVEEETVGQGTEAKIKPVLHFDGDTKPMVLNATNLEILAEAFGNETDEWAGNKIKIRCVVTQFQGKKVDGLRVEPIVVKPALKDDLNDEITI